MKPIEILPIPDARDAILIPAKGPTHDHIDATRYAFSFAIKGVLGFTAATRRCIRVARRAVRALRAIQRAVEHAATRDAHQQRERDRARRRHRQAHRSRRHGR